MYGMPEEKELSRLIGKTLIQLCIGSNQIIFQFDDDVRISVESSIEHVDVSGTAWKYVEFWKQHLSLTTLLSQSLVGIEIVSSKKLVLQFSNGEKVVLVDDCEHYEVFQVQIGDKLIVV